MRVFDHPNMDGFCCPICGTSEDKPVVLIPIDGTENNGLEEAEQYHLDCLNLRVDNIYTGAVIYHYFYPRRKE